MSVIIRLQNLPWSANALDIRQYFQGLSIPEGGVHIVGGELGDAFIAFTTDEDARQAFCKNHGKIKEVQINLLLSSRTEMQKVIEAARNNQSLAPFMPSVPPAPSAPIMPAIVPSAVPEVKKDDRLDRRDRRRSRSRSRDRKERSYDRKRDRRRSRSKSRDRSDRSDRSDRVDRNRDRRRRDRSRSRERTRSRDRDRRNNRDRRSVDKPASSTTNVTKEHRTNVWESPPATNPVANSANLLANFVANNILPNILSGNVANTDNTRNVKTNPWNNRNLNLNNMQGDNSFIPSLLGTDSNKGNGQMANMNRNQNNSNFQNYNQNNRGGPINRDKNDFQPNACVKVYPFFGGFGEIRQFFKGVFIHNNGIKLINDSHGKRTGYVYIRFATCDGKAEALNRNGEKLKGVTLTIQHLDDGEYDEAVDRFIPNDDRYRRPRLDNFVCMLVDNIPSYARDIDIMNMFSDFPTISVVIDNLPNKTSAYVKFKSKDDAMTAFMEKETHVIGGKNVKVEPCKEELFEKVRDEQIETVDLCDDSSSIIGLSGLPFKCSDRDILDFFSDIGVRPAKTSLKIGDLGFTGDAICEFFSVDDAVVAFQKNGMPFGNSTVSMKYLEENPMKPKPPMHNHNSNHNSNNPNFQPMHPGMRMRAPFFPRTQFMGMPRGPPFRPPFFMGNRGPPPRRFPPPQMPAEEVGEDESLGPPGCVLLMENVPYKAGVNEILEYFDGFEIPAENILRKFNPNGSPSGEAKVIFNSANEVQQVIQTKRGGRIRDRLIYMTQL